MTEELLPINTVSHQLGEHPGMPLAMLSKREQFARFWANYKLTVGAAMRDGVHASQAVAIIEDREHRKMPEKEARERLDALIADWRSGKGGL